MTQQNATFCGVAYPGGGAMTARFELGRDYCAMHLPRKFHRLVFTRLEIIMLTHKHTHKQKDAAENIQRPLLRYDVG